MSPTHVHTPALDPCLFKPCGNGGTCVALDSVNSTCMYSDVHSGVKCGGSDCQSKLPGSCQDAECPGNSSCVDYVEEFRCMCNKGFTGENCTKGIYKYSSILSKHTTNRGIMMTSCACLPLVFFNHSLLFLACYYRRCCYLIAGMHSSRNFSQCL